MDLDQLKEKRFMRKSVGVAHRGIAGHLALRSGEPGSSRACLPRATAVVRWTPSSHWSQWVSLQGSHSWHGAHGMGGGQFPEDGDSHQKNGGEWEGRKGLVGDDK